jgi:hypothetical protein
MKFFQELTSFFYDSQKRVELFHPFSVHFQFRSDIQEEVALVDLRSRIRPLLYICFQVTEGLLTEQIPVEYIGIASWSCGGKLLFREYLMIQEECVEKKIFSSQRIL